MKQPPQNDAKLELLICAKLFQYDALKWITFIHLMRNFSFVAVPEERHTDKTDSSSSSSSSLVKYSTSVQAYHRGIPSPLSGWIVWCLISEPLPRPLPYLMHLADTVVIFASPSVSSPRNVVVLFKEIGVSLLVWHLSMRVLVCWCVVGEGYTTASNLSTWINFNTVLLEIFFDG